MCMHTQCIVNLCAHRHTHRYPCLNAALHLRHERSAEGSSSSSGAMLHKSGGESESAVAQSRLTLCDPMDCIYQAPPFTGFSRQEYWSGLPFPSPGIFLTQGLIPGLLHCRQTLYRLKVEEESQIFIFLMTLLLIILLYMYYLSCCQCVSE